jgi:hypothetical protein
VLRRLSRPLKIRSFLVGLGRCDAKAMFFQLCHTLLQIRLQEGFLASFTSRYNSPVKVGKHPVAQRQFPAMKT